MLKKSTVPARRTATQTDLKTAAIAALALARSLLEAQHAPRLVTHADHLEAFLLSLDETSALWKRCTAPDATLPLSLRLPE